MTTEQTIKKNELELALLNDFIERVSMHPDLVKKYKEEQKKAKRRLQFNKKFLSSKI